ncbi:hypothetical protein OAO87_01815, partial [bacterium]|nr:hypothetical protein [bacterium]
MVVRPTPARPPRTTEVPQARRRAHRSLYTYREQSERGTGARRRPPLPAARAAARAPLRCASPGPSGAARLHALALRPPPPPPPSAAAAAARLLVVASPAADADRFVAVEGLLLLEQQEDIEQLEQRVQHAWSSKPCCLPSAAGAADAAGAVGAVQAAAGSTWRVSCACRADLEGSTRGVCRLVA